MDTKEEATRLPLRAMKKLVKKGLLPDGLLEVASYAKKAAPWHGRSTYGGLSNGVWRSPSEFCTEEAAVELLDKATKAVNKAAGFVELTFSSSPRRKSLSGSRTNCTMPSAN